MPVTSNTSAPYAPVKTVLSMIERHREKGLPRPIDTGTLARAGVPESLLPRVLQSLSALDLIDEDRNPTAIFESLRLAPADEYKTRMVEWLQQTYADVFKFVDPAKDGEVRIRDAFRSYQPTGQQDRMMALFVGLCVAAGIMPEKPATSSGQSPRPVTKPKAMVKMKPVKSALAAPTNSQGHVGLHPAISGLLQSLPSNGNAWTEASREKFLATFAAVLDFAIPVAEAEDQDNEGDTDQ